MASNNPIRVLTANILADRIRGRSLPAKFRSAINAAVNARGPCGMMLNPREVLGIVFAAVYFVATEKEKERIRAEWDYTQGKTEVKPKRFVGVVEMFSRVWQDSPWNC